GRATFRRAAGTGAASGEGSSSAQGRRRKIPRRRGSQVIAGIGQENRQARNRTAREETADLGFLLAGGESACVGPVASQRRLSVAVRTGEAEENNRGALSARRCPSRRRRPGTRLARLFGSDAFRRGSLLWQTEWG